MFVDFDPNTPATFFWLVILETVPPPQVTVMAAVKKLTTTKKRSHRVHPFLLPENTPSETARQAEKQMNSVTEKSEGKSLCLIENSEAENKGSLCIN